MRSQILLVSLGLVSLTQAALSQKMNDFFNQNSKVAQTGAAQMGCVVSANYTFYDLRALRNNETDYQAVDIKNDKLYVFNFCQYVNSPCDTTEEAYAYRSNFNASQCEILTDDSFLPSSAVVIPYNPDKNSSIITQVRKQANPHILITQDGGYVCDTVNNIQATLNFEIYCDSTETTRPDWNSFMVDASDECNPTIRFFHASGCSVGNMNSFVAFTTKNPWFLGIILIVLGAIVLFQGQKLLPYVVGVCAGIITFFLSMLLCSIMGLLDYLDPSQESSFGSIPAMLFSFILSIGLAILVGYLMKKFFLIGFCVLGGIAGFFLGGLFFNVLLAGLIKNGNVILFLNIVLACVGAFLCFKKRKDLAILTTAFIGAYAFIRGCSMFFGGYPNEIQMYSQISDGTMTYTTSFYIYLSFMTLCFVIGAFYQEKHKHSCEDHFEKQNQH